MIGGAVTHHHHTDTEQQGKYHDRQNVVVGCCLKHIARDQFDKEIRTRRSGLGIFDNAGGSGLALFQ